MRRILFVAVLSLALGACATTSTDAGASSDTSNKTTEASKPKKDCKMVKTTGGRLGRKVCS